METHPRKRIRLHITGKVQGVGFRFFTQRSACTLGLTGFVRNEPDGSVTIEAEGPEGQLSQFITLVNKGPQWAHVAHVAMNEMAPENDNVFTVH